MLFEINFDNNTATGTRTLSCTSEKLYSLLFQGAFSDKVTHLSVIKTSFVTSKIIRAIKVCLAREVPCSINGTNINTWSDLNPYTERITEFIEDMNSCDVRSAVLTIISKNKELIPAYQRGNEFLHTFLDAVIRDSGYDVSLSSESSYDTLSCGTYEDRQGHKHEYARNFTKKVATYRTSLLDKLNLYLNIKWYREHDIDTDTDGIGRHDVDSYVGESLTTILPFELLCRISEISDAKKEDPHLYADIDYKFPDFDTIDSHMEKMLDACCKIWNFAIDPPIIRRLDDVVVPVSACSLSTQAELYSD